MIAKTWIAGAAMGVALCAAPAMAQDGKATTAVPQSPTPAAATVTPAPQTPAAFPLEGVKTYEGRGGYDCGWRHEAKTS